MHGHKYSDLYRKSTFMTTHIFRIMLLLEIKMTSNNTQRCRLETTPSPLLQNNLMRPYFRNSKCKFIHIKTHAYIHGYTADSLLQQLFLILLKFRIIFKSMHMDDTRVQIYVCLSLILPVPTMDLNIFETFQNLITFESLHIEY